jgi:hypothetical protein
VQSPAALQFHTVVELADQLLSADVELLPTVLPVAPIALLLILAHWFPIYLLQDCMPWKLSFRLSMLFQSCWC